jgi:hypothetical protein
VNATDVITGSSRWSVEAADATAFLRGLPDDSIDLLFTSPPYLKARTYGIDADRGTEDWVSWMAGVVEAAATKVRGLIAVVCEGQTRKYRYEPSPLLLAADLHRKGFNLRKPVVFHRVGIPGSGGPDWLRNDWEPVLCVTRPGRLPWSDPTACGEPNKYGIGGALSHRSQNGERVSHRDTKGNPIRGRSGDRSGDSQSIEGLNGKTYRPPELANPGNVLKIPVGGGRMGHGLAHENEAPFPLKLAEFFVRTFCPPDGIVCDPFAGSGTTCHAAVVYGRRFVGCDVRESQAELTRRRMETVTPVIPFFAGDE